MNPNEVDEPDELLPPADAPSAEDFETAAKEAEGYARDFVLAYRANVELRARVKKLEAALLEIERRVPPDYGGTHYEGCEEHHDWCAVLKQARAALSEETADKEDE